MILQIKVHGELQLLCYDQTVSTHVHNTKMYRCTIIYYTVVIVCYIIVNHCLANNNCVDIDGLAHRYLS